MGTITEVYDYLRVLYARVGHPHCFNCGPAHRAADAEQIVDQVELPEGTRFQVLAPGSWTQGRVPQAPRRAGPEGVPARSHRRRSPGASEPIRLPSDLQAHDRGRRRPARRRPEIRRRVADSIETALELAEGIASIAVQTHDGGEEQNFSQSLACTYCGLSFERWRRGTSRSTPPYGACPTCDGLGTRLEVDPELVVPDGDLSVSEGALAPWASAPSNTGTE